MSNATYRWKYSAPDTLDESSSLQISKVACPILLRSTTMECPICLDPIRSLEDYCAAASGGDRNPATEAFARTDERISDYSPCLQLLTCGHTFHMNCLLESMTKSSSSCPMCRAVVLAEPKGKSPSGQMSVRRLDEFCPGFGSSLTLSIHYRLHGGVQKSYHDHPGAHYPSETRIAYLPDSTEGHHLLKRLVYAFLHGLTFRIGTSLTTGRSDQVVWASIHHKTCLTAGPYGYPDPTYLQRCHEELNQLGVPDDPPVPDSE